VLGVVENMASFVCPGCGEESRIFSGTTGQELASSLGVPFLGSVPLDPAVGEASDKGLPSIVAHPERPQAEAFRAVARALAAQASVRAMGREAAHTEFAPA
jgi:ATP-binding protein involved in chromosome partitioning